MTKKQIRRSQNKPESNPLHTCNHINKTTENKLSRKDKSSEKYKNNMQHCKVTMNVQCRFL